MIWWALALAQSVVELPEGPTLASLRVRAMGGTCVSLAESATCHIAQPASVAVHRPADDDATSFDSTIQLPHHPVFRAVFGGENPAPPDLHIRMQAGAALKVDRFGVGLQLRQDRWRLPGRDRGSLRWSMPVGVSNGVVTGAVAPVVLVGQFQGAVSPGWGVEGGVLWAPDGSPWRLGLAAHSPVRTGRGIDDALRSPAKVTTGVGYGVGLRNQNREGRWTDRVRSGSHWLQIHGELEWVGGSGEAVGLLDEVAAPAGVTARLGAEADLWEETFRVRAGTYGLLDRATGRPIPRATAGATVHLFTFLKGTRIRGGTVLDAGAEDTAIGFGLETW